MTSSFRTVELGVTLAGVILPAWPIWRIRRGIVSVPISALLSCWLFATLAAFTVELNADYDAFGAGMGILFAPGIGIGYALILAALHAGTKRKESPWSGRGHVRIGLLVWAGLFVFSVVIPFLAPPPARRGDPLYLTDYFFFCGRIVFLALILSLVYLWQVACMSRASTENGSDTARQKRVSDLERTTGVVRDAEVRESYRSDHMNKSVLVAAMAIGLMVFARLFMGVLALLSGQASIVAVVIPIAVALLILYGIIMGHRLAWQWGRLLGLLAAILLTLIAVGLFSRAGEPGVLIVAVLVALQGVPLFPMFFALGTKGAREHFRVVCPACGGARPKAGNFLFTEAVCRKCGARWR